MTYEQWLAAYLSVLGISLTVLGVVIAIVALWGYREIKAGAAKKAEETADQRIREFLAGEKLEKRLKLIVEEAANRLFDDLRMVGAFSIPETGSPEAESKQLGKTYPEEGGDVR